MRLPFERETIQAKEAGARTRKRFYFACVVLVLASALAWALPSQKPEAAFGRLGYLQFWTAALLTAITLSVGIVGLSPQSGRRATGFRVAAVWFGLGSILIVTEAFAWFLPIRHQMDNPYYFAAGGGTSQAEGLPFGRPAHLKWSGMSRGDMAILNDDDDPYAQPVTFETDSEGFRNHREVPNADLITIGDSFTEAGNVSEEKTFPALVGQKLSMAVRNLGRAGYTVPTELIVLKQYGLKSRPKLVVWQIAEANDLAEVVAHEEWLTSGHPYFDFERKGKLTRPQAWRQRSPSFKVFAMFRDSQIHSWLLSGIFKDNEGIEHPIRFFPSEGIELPVPNHQGWNGFTNALSQGAQICQSNHIKLLVVLIPDKLRVFREYTLFPEKLANWVGQRPGLREPALGTQLAAFCARGQIPFLDATDALKNQAKAGELVYLPFDTHLSAAGHQTVAQLIEEAVAGQQLNQPADAKPK